MQRFGEKLRELRKRRGMTLVQLTHALGYTNNGYISLIENGKIVPRVDFVLKVSDLFRTPTDRLLRDELDLESQPLPPAENPGSDNKQ